MNFQDLISGLIADSGKSLFFFSPELMVILTIVTLLFVHLRLTKCPALFISIASVIYLAIETFLYLRVLARESDASLGQIVLPAGRVALIVLAGWLLSIGLVSLLQIRGSSVAIAGTFVGLALSVIQFYSSQGEGAQPSIEIFTGLLLYDQFTVFFRIFLLLFLLFVIYLTMFSGIPDQEDAPDFYVLLLGSTLGMMLMASANHLLILFLSIEMASVPSYAMVGFLKGRKLSSEAALKYVVYGGGAAGVMLYGISLLAGMLGTAQLTSGTLGASLASALTTFGATHHDFGDPAVRTLVLAILMVLVGVAFKLSVFPFHFWCPDAFEGAAAEVAGYLSVASKAAAFGLLVRICLAIVGQVGGWGAADLSGLYLSLGIGIGIIAAVTATFGNLAAYTQTNIKRMLAYSTIAHAGYMLMAVAALMTILNGPAPEGVTSLEREAAAEGCVQGLLYYLAVYFFMNLGAFAIVALIRNKIFSEEIADYAGLVQQAPGLAVCMLICMFSLVGLPPLGGFVGKFMVFASLFEAGSYHRAMWVILVLGGLNTVFSLFYYLRVLKCMFIAPLPEGARDVDIPLSSNAGWYVLIVSVPVLVLGIFVDPISRVALNVAQGLF